MSISNSLTEDDHAARRANLVFAAAENVRHAARSLGLLIALKGEVPATLLVDRFLGTDHLRWIM
jgi:hypothetical protein